MKPENAMSKMNKTCLECGARLAVEAEQCDLCGSPVESAEAMAAAAQAEMTAEPLTPSPDEEAADHPLAFPPPSDRLAVPKQVYCNQCGWQNPVGARYCSMCGTPLQEVDPSRLPAAPPPATVPAKASIPHVPVETSEDASAAAARDAQAKVEHRAVSRQVGIIVGAGVLLVVALFLVTAVSKTRPVAPPAQAAQTTPSGVEPGALPPLASQIAGQAEALEAEIAPLSGEARIAKQRELIALLFDAGRLDRAALEQQKIAQATETPNDWKRAGDLFYDWMDPLEGAEKAQVAGQVIDAYQRVLAVDPDNIDVRTDLATAYLSSNNPMQGVAEIKRVLAVDPNHLHARFNYGIMLAMIGRSELAIEQFERVKGLVDETSSYSQQADDAIRAIQAGGSL